MTAERDGNGLTRHQQHVVAHVLNCELLGITNIRSEVILSLDVPFVWSIAADGSMDLGIPAEIADRLGLSEDETAQLTRESEELRSYDLARDPTLFEQLPQLSRVVEVTSPEFDDGFVTISIECESGRVVIKGEAGITKASVECK
ncbi:MAG TPA: hypothetical protein VFC63_03835 [Blastocatellia bacterium]|nr:hypothetical protein [Blastocatellia bacterium]